MISKLKGLIEDIGDTWVDIDVQGVCYRLSCSAKTLSSLPAIGEAVTLCTQMIVREDDISLLGFQNNAERSLFQLLTSVQGVGTRVGLALFSIGSPDEIVHAIASQDKAFICRADGVGPKLASRLLNELKDKVGSAVPLAQKSSSAPVYSVSTAPDHRDAVAGLVSLGYRSAEAAMAVDYVLKNDSNCASVQDIIRLSLAKLSRS
tara:strand:+ start:176 stop:790 length:615 start_codon:yes stop_codon:yes gene_type:complete